MEQLKRRRGSTKAKFTRLQSYFEKCKDSTQAYNADDLTTRLENLDSTWTEYNTIQDEIYAAVDDASLAGEETEYSQAETRFYSLKSGMRQLLARLTPSTSSNGSQSAGGSTATPIVAPPALAEVKLPRMDLPTFSGSQLEWTSFHDLFQSIVHVNTKISDSQKLHYLKNSLRDEAAGLLQSVEITDANYSIAWTLLRDRYQNQRQLIQCHLKSMFSQSPLISESSSNLRQLLDTTSKHVRALGALGLPTTHWDHILVYLVTDRLDSDSRRQWELSSSSSTYPTFDELKKFLEQRCRALEATGVITSYSPKVTSKQTFKPGQSHSTQSHVATANVLCPHCGGEHFIYKCSEFVKLDVKSRNEAVNRLGLCYNCLRPNHTARQCQSKSTCKNCKKSHNTLLHSDHAVKVQEPAVNHAVKGQEPAVVTHAVTGHVSQESATDVLLSTIIVKVMDSTGGFQLCRALLDNGSQASFITEACAQRLQLKRSGIQMSISGIGNSGSGDVRGKVNITVASTVSTFSMSLDALIMRKLTCDIPSSFINTKNWTHLGNLKLADESFNQPGKIDLLLGADVYEDVVDSVKIVGPEGVPTARSTRFGWTLSGRIGVKSGCKILSHVSTVDLGPELQQFWELEDVGNHKQPSVEEEQCETHFVETHTRDFDGRFITSLPFKEKEQDLGSSKEIAVRRLNHVERRLEKFPQHKPEYHRFMDQYLELGHMERIPPEEQPEVINKTNYLPHHFVLKEDSTTTKLRVVFDASAKTTTEVSLNDKLMVGPKVQDDMYFILMRFRLYKYVFTADITKMYRQIRVRSPDDDFQRILWRKFPTQPIEEFRLTTVTYGTASAPFVATRALQQLAVDEKEQFPLASQVALRDFYVDDVMSGSNSLLTAVRTQTELINMMKLGGFPLTKWSSNDDTLLQTLPPE